MLQRYQERVIVERKELSEKVTNLGAFMFKDTFKSLSADEQRRLVKQYAYMVVYLETLDERIAAWPE